MDESHVRVCVCIRGVVQGVFFRASTLEQAQRLNLVGTVQNLADGRVEVYAEGQRFALEDLLQWCGQGPPEARVEDVEVRWLKATHDERTFRVL